MDFLNYFLGEQPVLEKEKRIVEYIPQNRFSSFVSLDKPIYKLEEIKLKEFKDSTFSFCYSLPKHFNGGKYKIKAKFNLSWICTSEREFEIREFQNPRLNSHIEFLRKGYGPNDKVIATLDSKRVEGGYPKDAKVNASASIDGEEVWKETYILNEKGNCLLQFTLPSKITKGDGNLTCIIEDGGVVETATKTIPIFIRNIKVSVYPEGGELVENLESRFYCEASTSYGDPADLISEIITEKGETVGTVITKHEGRGRGSFTPLPKTKYFLKVIKPSGILDPIPLPTVIPSGVVLTSKEDAYESESLISLSVQASKAGVYYASIFKREIELSRIKVKITKDLEKKDINFSIPSNQSGSGVLRVLISDGKHPFAERLIFVKPSNSLHTTISPEYHSYSPGDKVKVTVQTKDSFGNDIDATLGVFVSDLSVLETLEKRKRPPSLSSMIYFESDVEHLEDADVYLSHDPKADSCIDLLLGTQGWRRFCFENPVAFLNDKSEKAQRVLAIVDDIEIFEEDEGITNKPNTSIKKSRPIMQAPVSNPPSHGDPPLYLAIYGADSMLIDEYPFKVKNNFKSYREVCGRIIEKISRVEGTKRTLTHDFYDVHLMFKNQRFYFLITKVNSKKRLVWNFLDHVSNFSNLKTIDFQIFEMDKIEQVQQQIDEVKRIMIENIDKVIARGEKLEALEDKTEMLSSMSDAFRRPTQPTLFQSLSNSFQSISLFNTQEKPPVVNEEPQLVENENIKSPEEIRKSIQPLKKYTKNNIPNDGYIREYAHDVRKNRKIGERIDFTETLYFAASLQTKNGKTTFSFDLSDSITSFSILTDGFTHNGIIGSNNITIQSSEPFYIEPKLPIEVSVGDTIHIPLSFVNNSQNNLKIDYSVESSKHLISKNNQKGEIEVKGNERKREIIEVKALLTSDTPIIFNANSETSKDQVSRNIRVLSNGYPVSQSTSGLLQKESKKFTMNVSNLIQGSLKASFNVNLSQATNLFNAVNSLVKEPYGCFEQLSSTSFPLTMAYSILNKQNPIDTTKVLRAVDILERTYQKLVQYECKTGGVEWFGNGDGVETLTAYGILQFKEMSKIINVDQLMVNRLLLWLIGRRDGNGGFHLNKEKSYQMGSSQNPKETSDSYIIWALTEAKVQGLEKEISSIYSRAKKSKDSYVIALASISLFNSGDKVKSEELATILVNKQEKDGYISGGVNTITRSYKDMIIIEVTALTIIAWTKLGKFNDEKLKALEYLYQNCKNFVYGSTQSTVLSLKAITENHMIDQSSFKLELKLNDKEMKLDLSTKESHQIPVEDYIQEGDNVIEVLSSSKYPFSLDISYESTHPKIQDNCRIKLETSLSKDVFSEGETGQITFNLISSCKEDEGMTVVSISLPGGLEPDHEKLKEMLKDEKFAFYEIIGRSIVIYFHSIEAESKKTLSLNVIARIPGIYEGQSNRAFIYYSSDDSYYSPGLKCQIEAK